MAFLGVLQLPPTVLNLFSVFRCGCVVMFVGLGLHFRRQEVLKQSGLYLDG